MKVYLSTDGTTPNDNGTYSVIQAPAELDLRRSAVQSEIAKVLHEMGATSLKTSSHLPGLAAERLSILAGIPVNETSIKATSGPIRAQLLAYIKANPGSKTQPIHEAVRGNNGAISAELRNLVADGEVTVENVPGSRARHYTAVEY